MSITVKTLYGQDGKTTIGVEARVSFDMSEWRSNEPLRNISLLQELRKARVPVIGALSITGVEYGVLSTWVEDDLDGAVIVYRWMGELPKVAPRLTSDDDL